MTPEGEYTMGDLLEDSQAVAGVTVDAHWVDEAFIRKHEAAAGGALPLWHPQQGADAVLFDVSGARARAAGMRTRPVRETARSVLDWWGTLPDERTAAPRAGLSAEREAELLAIWKRENA